MLNDTLMQNPIGDEEDQLATTTSIHTLFNSKNISLLPQNEPQCGYYLHNFIKFIFTALLLLILILLIIYIAKNK